MDDKNSMNDINESAENNTVQDGSQSVPEYITIDADNLTFRLEIFSGPLDLLLALIAKNKVNIYDIPISTILDQYLEYIHQMDLFNLEVASEFIVMAAQLMVIKSRMLLPKTQNDEQEDPRKELVDLLLEYKRAKQAAEILHELEFAYGGRFEKPPSPLPEEEKVREYSLEHPLSMLTQAYMRVYERNLERLEAEKNTQNLDNLIRTTRHVSVGEKIRDVVKRLSIGGGCAFSGLFEDARSRNEIVATFLAVLELIKDRKVKIEHISEDAENCDISLIEPYENADIYENAYNYTDIDMGTYTENDAEQDS